LTGWTEPALWAGTDPAALEEAVGLIQAHGAAAQVCVMRNGQVILDRSFGCRPDALFLIFSAGKPFVAVLVHLLAERGLLGLDDPVARYWPEFGQHGKEHITIRQVLQHRSGVPVARGILRDALAATSWRGSVHALETARPLFPPGQVPAYHILSYGFILGEVVQRATRADLRTVMRAELLDPLGLADTHLGLPAPLWPRHVPVRADGPAGLIRKLMFNYRAVRQAVIPALVAGLPARRPGTRSRPRAGRLTADGRAQQPGRLRPQRLQLLPRLGRPGPATRFRLPDQPAHGRAGRLTPSGPCQRRDPGCLHLTACT
jgi:CubicO group peptidase (beta-lactamase class C family)